MFWVHVDVWFCVESELYKILEGQKWCDKERNGGEKYVVIYTLRKTVRIQVSLKVGKEMWSFSMHVVKAYDALEM